MPNVMLGSLVGIVVILNIWATVTIRAQSDVPPQQRRLQVLFVWLLPVIGAVIAVEVYRRTRFTRTRPKLVADEIHPILDQALRPLADAEMRASEQYIEKGLTDFGHDSAGDGHVDGSH